MKYDIMMEWIDKVWSVRGNYFAHTKSILYMDQYGTHVRDEIVKYLRDQYGTECFWIPKRLTGVLQPLDVVVNAPFKAYMRQQLSRWFADPEKHFYTRAGNRKPPPYSEIVKFVSDAVKELNSNTVKKSFRVCGIAEKGDRIELNELHGDCVLLLSAKKRKKQRFWRAILKTNLKVMMKLFQLMMVVMNYRTHLWTMRNFKDKKWTATQ